MSYAVTLTVSENFSIRIEAYFIVEEKVFGGSVSIEQRSDVDRSEKERIDFFSRYSGKHGLPAPIFHRKGKNLQSELEADCRRYEMWASADALMNVDMEILFTQACELAINAAVLEDIARRETIEAAILRYPDRGSH